MARDPRYDPSTGALPGDQGWPGARARYPLHIPGAGWLQIAKRVYASINEDQVFMMAAALAFYGVLAVFPFLISLITLYGLVLTPDKVQHAVVLITQHLSHGLGAAVGEQLGQIITARSGSLGVGLVISLLFTFWAASSGMHSLLSAVNLAYDEKETRSYFKVRLWAIVLTGGAILFMIIALALIAILPSVIGVLHIGETTKHVVYLLRWPLLLICGMLALVVVYAIGPDRQPARWSWTKWGSFIAVLVWLAISAGFSLYVEKFANYNRTYGSLGAVIVLLMWFYLTAFVILLGAEINSELELQTAVDTTTGPPVPRGERGAVKADHVPGDQVNRKGPFHKGE